MQVSNYASAVLLDYYSSGLDVLAPYSANGAGEEAEQQWLAGLAYSSRETRMAGGREPELKALYASTSMVDYYSSL